MMMNKLLKENRSTIGCVVLTVIVSVFLFKYVLYLGFIPSESMEPTLEAGNIVIGIRRDHNYQINDIVIFEKENHAMIKRIAADQDDLIEYKAQKVLVNGVEMGSIREGYVDVFQIEKDHYYMLGDNCDHSYDSRYWDQPSIDKSDVLAKVIWIIPT